MSDKDYKKIEIIAWSVVAIVLTVFLSVVIKKDAFSLNNLFNHPSSKNMKVIKTYTVDNTEKLKDINLDIDDGQIKLLESKDNNIYITIKSNKNIKSLPVPCIFVNFIISASFI